MNRTSVWEPVLPSVYLYRDSCNVYAIIGDGASVLVNAGTGSWISHLSELPAAPRALLCTHHFRDHVAGTAEAARAGMEVYAPYWEREFFEDAEGLFQRRETYIIYDNIWDLYGPGSSIPVAGWLRDWDHATIGGIPIQVIPTAGVTPGAVSLMADCEGKKVLFCGELIHSPGKIARVAPLQYHYNDLTGGMNLLYSLHTVRELQPDILAPSLGPSLIDKPESALNELEQNLRGALSPRPDCAEPLRWLSEGMPLTRITDSVYQAHHSEASTYFLISRTREVMAIDFGYEGAFRSGSGYPYPRNRVSTLHSLAEIEKLTGKRRVDGVFVTHFHDDHVNGIPLLQRLFGTKCYAGENFAHILSNPQGYAFPCTWPEPIEVEAVPASGALRWNEFTFHVHPMSGHTRWSTIVEFEADGKKFAATGDQYFFWDFERPGEVACMHNHVYRNGAVLSSFHESNQVVERIAPDFILPGHGRAYQVTESFYSRLREYADEYQHIHANLMPLASDEVHFEVDSRAAWLEPYRIHLPSAGRIELDAHVRNPYPRRANLSIELSGPDGWKSEPTSLTLPPRAEGVARVSITPPDGTSCRRQAVLLGLSSEEREFGQVAEALVTIGEPVF